jgi:hypothetical protein
MRDESLALKTPFGFLSSNDGHGNSDGNGHGNGHGGGNGHGRSPILITGRYITSLTNNDASQRDAIAAMLVRNKAQLISPTVPQAAALTLRPIGGVYSALHLSPVDLALAAEIKGLDSRAALDVFVKDHLADVWDAISRAIA